MMEKAASFILLLSVLVALWSSATGATNGGWASWSRWSGCAAGICAGNQRIRTRTCTNPLPSDDGLYCDEGDSSQQQDCQIDGGFTEWSQWSICENPCGGSVVNRTRGCTNPTPSPDGMPCSGPTVETKMECVGPCPTGPLDGNWGFWSPWTRCPKTCGISAGSIISRTRVCNNPPPMNGGKQCVGDDRESVRSCFAPCPVDGGFGLWSAWATCSKTCGTGTKSRSRLCNNPVPASGGENCTADFTQARSCQLRSCPGAVNGGWTPFSSWSTCTESTNCLQGTKKRTRSCTNPPPANGGDSCVGLAEEEKICPTQADGCTPLRPQKPDKTQADPNSWIALECGAAEKFSATGSYKQDIPAAVYSNFDFMRAELESGYFAVQMVPDDQDDYGRKQLKKVCFEITTSLTIDKVVTNRAGYYKSIDALPEWTKPELTETVPAFTIWIDESQSLRKYEFQCAKSDEYVPLPGFIMKDVRFSYYSQGNSQTFKAKGKYTLQTGTVFETEVKKDVLTGAVHATGNAESVTFIDMMVSFGLDINILPDFLVTALKKIGLWEFTMSPAQLTRKLVRNGVIRFTSSLDLGGVPVHIEILTGIRFGRPTFAVGFSFDRYSYGKLAEKLSGIGVDFLDKLGLEFEIGVSFHPPAPFQQLLVDSETKFSKEPLHSFVTTSVPQGIFAAAQIILPRDCKGNKFCEIMKLIVGPTIKWYITGQFQWRKIRVATGFANVRIYDGLYFHKLELYVEADWNDSANHIKIGFRADIKVPVNGDIYRDGIRAPNSELFLFGVLEYDFQEQVVGGKLGMRGIWRRAFFIPFLGIGNIFLGLTYKVGAPIPITGVQFGMRVEFGYDCLIPADFNNDGHCFGGSGYFGVGSPQFFYADFDALTLGKIIRLLGFTIPLPPPIAQTGFPEGGSGSYAEEAFDLRIANGPYIPEGFAIKGRVNTFGWSIYAHIKLSESAIFIDLKPDPIKILDLITIVRSPTDKDKGPWWYLDARKSPPFIESYVEGHTNILGISTYCRLNLTTTRIELLVQGNFLNLIKAELYMTASYSLTWLGTQFYIRINVDLHAINNALDAAARAVKGAFDAAQMALADAKAKVVREKENCRRKLTLECDNCKRLKCAKAQKDCKGFLNAAGKWIGGVVDKAGKWIKGAFKEVGKKLAPVGKAIKKFFKGWKRRREILDKRNENFELHLRRRRFISKILCEGLVGGGCNAVSSLCEGSCKVVNHIGQGLCNVLDIAIGALTITERATAWVGRAIDFVLTKLFRVYSIKFEFSLEAYARGDRNNVIFNAAIDLLIFGKRYYLATEFNLRDPVGSLRSGSDKATEWYKSNMNNEQATAPESNFYDSPNPYADFEMSETFLIENQQAATDSRTGACLYVDSKDDGAFIKVTGCNENDDKQNWAYTLKGQIENYWSKLCIDSGGAATGSKLKQTACNPVKDDQNFQCDLTVRTLMRRRSDKCWTLGTSTINGPGPLVHRSSSKCIHVKNGGFSAVPDGTGLVIYAGCYITGSANRLEFALEDGYLKHIRSGKCAKPIGAVTDDVVLGMYSSCEGHKFSFTAGGSLQHIASRKCVNPKSGAMIPGNGDDLVLNSKCENSDFSENKKHLLYTFLPRNPYVSLEKCTNFDEARLDQRFEIMDESVASICSKFARNLAYHKTTEQSSTAHNGFSSRAVDENYSSFYNDNSCTHTRKEQDPWWRVDLGREYIVTDVMIVNRHGSYQRLKNFDVKVGISKNNKENPTCHDRVRYVDQAQALRVQCDPPIPGRYVSVQMYQYEYLTLCEVAVYSRVGSLADLCQLNNGGCEQVCYNLCNLRVKCGCLPGYTLAYDGMTCIDRNECNLNNGGCDRANGRCVNSPGSFHCECNAGYHLQENNQFVCEDRNECGMDNAGCEQICSNSDGSFNCDCRAGFRLKSDKMGCEDIDECKAPDSGGCSHTCHNYEGGYYCNCPAGYHLMEDDKTCEEIYCPALEVPLKAEITPEICTDGRANIARNTACEYTCATGYRLVGDSSLVCQIDGFWQGTAPRCEPVMCPKLTVPANGAVVPSSCGESDSQYGVECFFECDAGYVLKGPRFTTCQGDNSWSDMASITCEKVFSGPWIKCPMDRVEELEPDKSAVALGYKWQKPQTNVDSPTVSPSNYDENYLFPVGKHRVMWTATLSGREISCTFFITVIDVTPPSVQGCPASFTEQTDTIFKEVTWKEPTFTDNVGVASVLSNRKPNFDMGAFSTLTIIYVATDAAGNEANCKFDITVEGTKCRTIHPPRNGVLEEIPGTSVRLICDPGFLLNPTPPGSPGLLERPLYECQGNKWISRDDQVSELTKHVDCTAYSEADGKACKEGSALMGGMCVNCPPGTYGDSGKCKECTPGFFQDTEGMTECMPCPKKFFSNTRGSTSDADCKPICRPGEYSINGGVDPCLDCPVGTYQDNYQRTKCHACPAGSTTLSKGSSSADDCNCALKITMTMPTRSQVLRVQQTVRLACFIEGHPIPKITWTKVGGSMPSGRVTIENVYDSDAKLNGVVYSIRNADVFDSGTYECKVENKFMGIAKRVTIDVLQVSE
nr:uncharacterized protein LOC131796502 [Pocillopora verrucosa]